MPWGKLGKYQRKIIVFYFSMAFVAILLMLGISIIADRNLEKQYLNEMQDSLSAINQRIEDNVASLYELSTLIKDNAIVVENLQPSEQRSARGIYQYREIGRLLNQSRLQFDNLVDVIFLYADEKKVIYSGKESGVTDFDMFFSSIQSFESLDAAFWKAQREDSTPVFSVLDPDEYAAFYSTTKKQVIPLVYHFNNLGTRCVLCMNVSVDKIARIYLDSRYFADGDILMWDRSGRQIYGTPDTALPEEWSSVRTIRKNGKVCYAAFEPLNCLGLVVCGLTPTDAFSALSSGYRSVMIGLILVFALAGLVLALLLSRRTYAPIQDIGQDIMRIQERSIRHPQYLDNELRAIRQGITELAQDKELYRQKTQQYSLHYLSRCLNELIERGQLEDESYVLSLLTGEVGFSGTGFVCVCIVVDLSSDQQYLSGHDTVKTVASQLRQAECLHGKGILTMVYQTNMIVALVDSRFLAGEDMLEQALQELTRQQTESYGLRIGIGKSVRNLTDVRDSFQDALTQIFAMEPEGTWTQEQPVRTGEKFIYHRSEMIAAANTHDPEEIAETAEEILEQGKRHHIDYREAERILRDIYDIVMDAQNRSFPEQRKLLREADSFNAMDVLILSPEINMAPLMGRLIRYIPSVTDSREMHAAEEITGRAKLYMKQHFTEDMSLDSMADAIGVSSKHLSRVFRQTTGIAISDYLTYLRMEETKKLLVTNMTLEQIAVQVGISNRSTFLRLFKKTEGMTPSQWRMQHRIEYEREQNTEDKDDES